jgi:hypothetical protein
MEFIIPKFIEGSTCFERHSAHHQELQTVFAASGLYTHVVIGRCPGCVGTRSPDDERSAARYMLSLQ